MFYCITSLWTRPCDLDLWPWKSIGFQIVIRTKYNVCTKIGQNPLKDVDSRVFTRMLWKDGRKEGRKEGNVPILVKIHWKMLILECSQGCYMVKYLPSDFDLWPMTLKSIGFQTLLRTKYVPSLVKIHWRMLILECSQGCYALKIWSGDLDLWPMTLKSNRIPDSLKD
jgi:hypothetical protein